jgi:autotransporter-associated beta strand protein
LYKRKNRPFIEILEDRWLPNAHTWTGAVSSSWSDARNWIGGSPKGDVSADVIFPSSGVMNFTGTDDIGGLCTIHSLKIDGAGYNLTAAPGSGLALAGDLLTTNTAGTNTLNLDITLSANSPQTFTVGKAGSILNLGGVISGVNDVTKAGNGTLIFSGVNTYGGTTTVAGGTLLINGLQLGSSINVNSGALLGGTGMVGPVTLAGGAISQVPNTGILTINGPVTFQPRSALFVSLNGTTAGSGYDQLIASGPIDLSGNPMLNLGYGFPSTVGDRFTLLSNGANSAVTGTFKGLAEGANLTLNGQRFQLSYLGGQGHDVVLTHIRDTTTTTLVADTNPSVFGQTVMFTATVAGAALGANAPTGAVTFLLDGSIPLGTGSLSSGRAGVTTSALDVGSHTITAMYSGDGSFTSSTSTPLSETINQANATVAVSSSAAAAVYGQPVTLTAAVQAASPGMGVPSGTVMFLDGANALGTGSLQGGSATLVSSALGIGNHTITAVYSGDDHFMAGTSPAMTQTMNQAGSNTVVRSSLSSTVYGQPVTFTAAVSAATPASGTPSGSVTLLDGSDTLGTATLNGGTASFTAPSLNAGSHTITATYSGDSNFTGSTSTAATQTVKQANSNLALSSSSRSVFGQAVTFTATLSVPAPGAGTPSGTISFLDGSTTLGTAALNNGSATWTSAALSVGTHTITAAYGGDSNFNTSASTALTQTVAQAGSNVTFSSSGSPTAYGQVATFTATVSASAPGAGVPSGPVTFLDGTNMLGTVTLNSGSAAFTAPTLSAGTHTITAVYNGDADFTGGTSLAVTQMVNPANTNLAVSPPTASANLGQTVTLTATVTAVAPGAGNPTGTVAFLNGQTVLGTATLSNDLAAFLSSPAVGNWTITAKYAGDSNFLSSTSATVSVVVGGPNQRFVDQVYQALLGRSADPNGLAAWSGLLDQGASRGQVVLGIENTPEYQRDLVQTLYSTLLGRPADSQGLNSFTAFLGAGGTVEQVKAAILGSPEYLQNRGGGTNDGFLAALYQDVLGRRIDPTGQADLTFLLANNTSRSDVAAIVLNSPEGEQNLVRNFYQRFLRRGADATGLNNFVRELQSGTSDQQIMAQVLGSDEFFSQV